MVSGVLKFKGYSVEKLSYNKKKLHSSEEWCIDPQVLFKFVTKEGDISKANILMGIRLGYEDNSPFELEAMLRGYFEVDKASDEVKEADIIKLYLQNGSAILYPYIRSCVTYLSSTGNYNPVILPTINFYKFIETQDIESLQLNPSEYEDFIE